MSDESNEEKGALEIRDVNHYDSRVFVQFVDGRSVVLTGKQILDTAERYGRVFEEAAQLNPKTYSPRS